MSKVWVPFTPEKVCRHDLSSESKRTAWWNVAKECGVEHFRIARKAGWELIQMEVVYDLGES